MKKNKKMSDALINKAKPLRRAECGRESGAQS